MRIAIASDHAGFQLKTLLLTRLSVEPDVSFVDLGTYAASPPVDYPDYARAAAEAVVRGDVDRSIVVCGSGAGACIAADKVPGARAFFAGDSYTAHQGVEHDDANVLCLGERVTGPELAIEIARSFLRAEFSGQERHKRRVGKVLAIEDIQNAADVLRPVYNLTGGCDGYVSLECAPAVANDTQATIAMTRDLWTRLARPNVMIKIPATDEGVPAIEESIASGINVN